MIVLGITGRRRDAAAALVVDGKLIAAVTEESQVRVPRVGYRVAGGFPFFATTACLRRAGITFQNVAVVASTDHHLHASFGNAADVASFVASQDFPVAEHADVANCLRHKQLVVISPTRAHAVQAAASANADRSLIVILDPEHYLAGEVFSQTDGIVVPRGPIRGAKDLFLTIATLTRLLGCDSSSQLDGLSGLATLGDAELGPSFESALSWSPDSGIRVQIAALTESCQHPVGDSKALADAATPNVRVQELRSNLAASFTRRIHTLVQEMLSGFMEESGLSQLVVGGSLFSNGYLNAALRNQFGSSIQFAPVPEAPGCAIGAALAAENVQTRFAIEHLSLGPQFSEMQVKEALDNARLDYIYEPSWDRLLSRVSSLLSQGKVVAWFQGAMDFGPRSLGSRSILSDPSNRYAKDNINRYLKGRAEDHPIAVSMPESIATQCLETTLSSPYMLLRATVKAEWRDRCRAVLDARHSTSIHTVSTNESTKLSDLLDIHFKKSGVPGLMNTTLSVPPEPTACTPRDAIRTTFSGAIDALVMNRFLVMKDYWLLRSDDAR